MRNVGGQVVGISSKSVFGQPGRVTGIVVGEWEERSPWAPLSIRRGVAPDTDALTVHGCTGTIDVADIVADDGRDLVEIIGKSLAFCGTNAFIGSHHGAEVLVCLAPPWADLLAATYPDVADVQAELARHAALPLSVVAAAAPRQGRARRAGGRQWHGPPRGGAGARARDGQRRAREPARAGVALVRPDPGRHPV